MRNLSNNIVGSYQSNNNHVGSFDKGGFGGSMIVVPGIGKSSVPQSVASVLAQGAA